MYAWPRNEQTTGLATIYGIVNHFRGPPLPPSLYLCATRHGQHWRCTHASDAHASWNFLLSMELHLVTTRYTVVFDSSWVRIDPNMWISVKDTDRWIGLELNKNNSWERKVEPNGRFDHNDRIVCWSQMFGWSKHFQFYVNWKINYI